MNCVSTKLEVGRWAVIRGACITFAVGVTMLTLLKSAAAQTTSASDAVPAVAHADAESNDSQDTKPANVLNFSQTQEIASADTFEVDVTAGDLADGVERAWEYRPYRVATWLCLDGSPQLAAIVEDLKTDMADWAELIDPSGWDVAVDVAPAAWRWEVLNEQIQYSTESTSKTTNADGTPAQRSITDEPLLAAFDKLMVVSVRCQGGATVARVRELDLTTGQWGPSQRRVVMQRDNLARELSEMIRMAFMPLAQIDRVAEKEGVFMIARAIESCRDVRQTAPGTFEVFSNEQSPVFIRATDRFLPVIRKTDRNGELTSIDPIEFTWLTINEINGPHVNCSIHSSQRAPLAGRKSKRSEKLALVIRPPDGPTKLTLVTGRDEPEPVEGVEVWSRKPNDDKDQPSEFIGKTDWRGQLEIEPNEDGLRIIFVKRGSRALMKLPIIPGLYDNLTGNLPDDQTRLYAQGVITGLSNQIVALVIQRQIFEQDIESALASKDYDTARQLMVDYSELESARDVRTRMTDEEIRLKTLTTNSRELEYIRNMFQSLRDAVATEASRSRETELQAKLQQATSTAE